MYFRSGEPLPELSKCHHFKGSHWYKCQKPVTAGLMPSQVLNSSMTSPDYIQMSADKLSFNLSRKRTWRITIESCLFRACVQDLRSTLTWLNVHEKEMFHWCLPLPISSQWATLAILLQQGLSNSANCGLWVNFRQLPCFVNKALLKHTCSFVYTFSMAQLSSKGTNWISWLI